MATVPGCDKELDLTGGNILSISSVVVHEMERQQVRMSKPAREIQTMFTFVDGNGTRTSSASLTRTVVTCIACQVWRPHPENPSGSRRRWETLSKMFLRGEDPGVLITSVLPRMPQLCFDMV
jgi:hypothetical protein